jgi:DUF4097 and DUF4098 domain-containing protein YvlB
MKRSHLLFAGLLSVLLPLSAFARIERQLTQTFAAQPGGTLTVDTQGGNIRVVPGSDHEVKVEAHLVFPKAGSDAEADAIMKDIGFSVGPSANGVTAVARGRSKRSLLPTAHRSVRVSFTVTVPTRFHANLKTSGGDLEIERLGGDLVAESSGGDLRLGHIAGKVEATTSGGDVRLASADGAVRIESSGGDINVGRIAASARLTTSGGDIDVADASDAVLAKTSGGDVRVRFRDTFAAASELTTSGGDIVARVTASAGFRLDARTSGGGIEAEGLAIRLDPGRVSRGRLAGTVNEGDATLTLRTSGGDIVIEQS